MSNLPNSLNTLDDKTLTKLLLRKRSQPIVAISDQILTPESIAEIFRLVTKLDLLERLDHRIKHKRTAITGQLLKLLSSHAGQVAWNLLDDDDLKSLRRQLKIVGISLDEVGGAIAQSQLIPGTIKTVDTKLCSKILVETDAGTRGRGDTHKMNVLPMNATWYEKVIDLGRPSRQRGSLYRYTSNKKDKNGNTVIHPRVSGERDPYNPNHWYWGLSYVVWDGSKWCDRTLSIARKRLSQVQEALGNQLSIQEILQVIGVNSR